MRIPGGYFLRNLIERRNLLAQLIKRDFQQRYVGSAAGWLWGVIHPLVLLASWTFVFQICMKTTLPREEVTQNYTLFLVAGYLPWMLFQETITRSSMAMIENANLITKTVFPAEIVPVAIFASSLMNHVLALILVLVAIAVALNQFSPFLLLLPAYMLLLGLFSVGIGWIVSSLQVYLRDTAQVVAVVMTFWFWTTPIFINEQQYPEQLRFLLTGNPLSFLVRAYRDRLLSNRLPSFEEFAIVAAYALVAFVAGGLFFRHLKKGFADVL